MPPGGRTYLTPQPVRPETVQEEEGQAVHEQENPPKTEGDRDEAGR